MPVAPLIVTSAAPNKAGSYKLPFTDDQLNGLPTAIHNELMQWKIFVTESGFVPQTLFLQYVEHLYENMRKFVLQHVPVLCCALTRTHTLARL